MRKPCGLRILAETLRPGYDSLGDAVTVVGLE
jgi:hypothetical protein